MLSGILLERTVFMVYGPYDWFLGQGPKISNLFLFQKNQKQV